jgi:hypothetical protein
MVRVLVVLAVCVVAMLPQPAHSLEVHGDDAADRFVGQGAIVLPAGSERGQRQAAAACIGCVWRMTDPCAHATDPGSAAACRTVQAQCLDGGSMLRAFISRDAGATWEYLGMHCIPETGPVTVASIGHEVQDAFAREVPPGSIRFQPEVGVLPHLPVIFDSGQPDRLTVSEHEVNGLRVRLMARATWEWQFGDGATLSTGRSGSRYPDLAVSHTYRGSGAQVVRLRTTWRAEYTVDGLGPIQVVEPVVQQVQAVVRVGQARAVLVP